jgi:hypothetical protein
MKTESNRSYVIYGFGNAPDDSVEARLLAERIRILRDALIDRGVADDRVRAGATEHTDSGTDAGTLAVRLAPRP